MASNFDLGEPTGEAAMMSRDQLEKALAGADTKSLDAAVDKQHGAYLDAWAGEIRRRIEERKE